MFSLTLLLVGLQAAPDSVALSAAQAFRQALDASPEVTMARERARAALDDAAQASAFANPLLSFTAENVGRAREITGRPSPDGIEGQLFLQTALPLGPTRRGTVGMARARGAAGEAQLRLVEQGSALDILSALGALVRAQVLADNAREELSTLEELASALALQAEEGRAARSDASRAQLAKGLAATALARKEAVLADAMTDFARRLGLDPGTVLMIEPAVCTSSSFNRALDPGLLPETEVATARLDEARWSIDLARGIAAPDLQPQLGVRRGGGFTALYLGFNASLPLFDRGSRAVAAARSRERAAEAELALTRARVSARRVAAERRLDALEGAGAVFKADWFEALRQTVTAAEARFALGEGTLFELLDHRRARLQAMDDYARWLAEWWMARAELARLSGQMPDATLLCTDPFRETDG